MRVLVTGSRDWPRPGKVQLELERMFDLSTEAGEFLTVVHGDCLTGADAQAKEWVERLKKHFLPVDHEPHEADWKGPRKRGAGYARNAKMVKLGADRCLAFILNESNGSTHCADLAEAAGIPTERFRMETKMAKRVKGDIKLEDITMLWRPNFAGEKRQFNDEGKRNFNIELDEETADHLADLGWPVKTWEKTDDEGKTQNVHFIKVKVNMEGNRPPSVFLISTTGRNEPRRTPMDAETIEILDALEFETVDVIITPHNYDFNGNQGVTAYLKTGFFILKQNDLEKKYAHIPLDGGEELAAIEDIIDVEGEWVDEEAALELESGR